MLWVIGFLIVIVALLIPILAIVLDSPFVHRLAESRRGPALDDGSVQELQKRLDVLEDEVEDLSLAMRQLRDETQFLQRLLESAEENPQHKLPPTT